MVAARDRASFEPVSHSRDLRARRLEPRLAHDDSTCKLVGLSDYGRFRPGRRLQHFVPGEPPLAAWTAFILCRHIARSYWPALLGGYLFGFSAYMVGQTFGGHLHLVLVFAVPLAVYLPALWLDGALKSLRFVVLMGLTLAVQFALSVEIFATAIMFGAMAIVLALAFTEGETRRRIGWMLVPVASSCVFAALLVSPCLYYMFAYPELRGPVWSLEAFSADVLNFLIPTETSALGHLAVANSRQAFQETSSNGTHLWARLFLR